MAVKKLRTPRLPESLSTTALATDYSALEAELSHAPEGEPQYEDNWADLYDDEGTEEEPA